MKIVQLFLLLLFCATSEAQFPDFHVFLVSGNVEVSKPGVKPIALKQNAFIFKDQIVTVKGKGELTLSDKNKNFYVLRTPGVYKAKDIAKANNYRVPGVTEKYLTLVWNELFNTHHDYSKFTKSNIAGVYGGVSRGSDCNNLLFPIPDLKTSEDSLHFTWLNAGSNSDYVFSIYNHEGKEMFNRQVRDTQISLSLKKGLDLQPGNYYWKAKSAADSCADEEPVSFELLSSNNEKKAVELITGNVEQDDLPANLTIIDKLEKAGLIPAASKRFESLLKNSVGNTPLLKSYILFLLRYKYNTKAQTLWENAFGKTSIPIKG